MPTSALTEGPGRAVCSRSIALDSSGLGELKVKGLLGHPQLCFSQETAAASLSIRMRLANSHVSSSANQRAFSTCQLPAAPRAFLHSNGA